MKSIHTAMHLNGKGAFSHVPRIERRVIEAIIAARHEKPRYQEVIGDLVVMLGEMVREPLVDGNFIVFDVTDNSQQLVNVHWMNSVLCVTRVGSQSRWTLTSFNQPYYRWIQVHPLSRDVLNDLRNRK